MTYDEKIEQSQIIKVVGPKSFKRVGIQTKKSRMMSIIIMILTSLYTIFTKFIIKDFSFDIVTVCIIINIASLVGLKFLNKSIFIKNKTDIFGFYRFLLLINKICKVIIFGFTFYNTILHLKSINLDGYNCDPLVLLHKTITKELPYYVLLDLDFNILLKLISTTFSLLLTIPSFISLIIFIFKIIILIYKPFLFLSPMYNFMLVLDIIRKKIKKKARLFKNYVIKDDGVYIEYRELKYTTSKKISIFLSILILILYLIIYYLFLYKIIINNLNFFN